MGCSVLLFPMLGVYEKLSRKLVKDEPVQEDRFKDELEALNPVFFDTPALALQSCYKVLNAILAGSRKNIERSFRLLDAYDEALHRELLADEDDIDRLTDRISRYSVELLSHLQLDYHVAILDQYYKVTAEFERLGDHAVNIAEQAAALYRQGTSFSPAGRKDLAVLRDVCLDILDETELTFRKRDIDAARRIEPLVQVTAELIVTLKHNHLKRMSRGECNVYADASFTNLMVEFRRIADVCSNVGVATVVRVHPELADHEHLYYDRMHSGSDEDFNTAYERAHNRYFSLLTSTAPPEPASEPVPPLFREDPEIAE